MIVLVKLLVFTLALLLPNAKSSSVSVKELHKSYSHKESSSYSASPKHKFLFLVRISSHTSIGSNNSSEYAGSFLKSFIDFAFLQSVLQEATLLGISYVILGKSGVDIIFPFHYFW